MNPHGYLRERRTLLVPLDGTAFSRRVLDQVRELFTPDRFRIALLHVAAPPANLHPPYHPAAVGPDYTLYTYDARGRTSDEASRSTYQRHALYEGHVADEYRQRLERDLERELTMFRSEGYDASATVHFGDPVEEIVAFARDASIAAIAMATHGRTGIGRLLQGSVAQDVLTRLDRPLPVLLVRHDD
jgi:nucleotide-binding universal stress UspA family protein